VLNDDALIEQYIEENPLRPGPADARLKEAGTAVWALVSYLRLGHNSPEPSPDKACRVGQPDDPLRDMPAPAQIPPDLWPGLSYLDRAVGGDVARAAGDYDVPVDAMEAALAYYRQHKQAIDARIAVSAA
jgi:hypothetical protein